MAESPVSLLALNLPRTLTLAMRMPSLSDGPAGRSELITVLERLAFYNLFKWKTGEKNQSSDC
jgi:hypothetical protein